MMIQQMLPPQKPLLLHIMNTSEIFLAVEPLIPRYSTAQKRCSPEVRNKKDRRVETHAPGSVRPKDRLPGTCLL